MSQDLRRWFSPSSQQSPTISPTINPSVTNIEKPITESNIIKVFTDGSAINNGAKNARGGIGVFFKKDDPRNISKKVVNMKITNNICELLAIIAAVEKIVETNHSMKGIIIHLYTDSEYIVNSVLKYSKTWVKNGYKGKNGKPIKNLQLMKRVLELYDLYNIKLKHCPAHLSESQHKVKEIWYGNKMADFLAREASK